MAKTKNTFIEGMDQDTSKSKYKNTKIYKGVNIKVLTEEGLSSGAIENEDGNKLSFTIPDTFPIYKIRFDNSNDPQDGKITASFTNPSTGLPILIDTPVVNNIENLYAELNIILAPLLTSSVKIFIRGKFVYVVCLDTSLNSLIGSDGLSNLTTYHVPGQTGLKIIGWSTLRDEVVLFTTNETSDTPTNSVGQIWKFNYDPITKDVNGLINGKLSLVDHLIYQNFLNFSTYWHIGTETVGHYENSKVGRVYWTDEYNQLRVINALDPELFSISPSVFGITEGFNMSIPKVEFVSNGGSLPDGAVVQYCYRLFSSGGNETVYSPVTNPIPLGSFNPTDTSEATGNRIFEAYGTIVGSGADKSVTYTISGLDTSFSFIEHIAIVTQDNSVEIYKFKEESVPSDGNLTVTHIDKGLNLTITEQEFNSLTRTFNRCKTITVKDKRLIAANLDTESIKLDNYDTRAYRFDSSRQALLTDTELPSVTIDGFNPVWTDVPEEHDTVNPFNKDKSDIAGATTTNQYKYQADGSTLGGQGPNISYTFTKKRIPIKYAPSGYIINNGLYIPNAVARNANVPVSGYQKLNGENRGHVNEFQSFKSPTMTGAFTGYARGEVYRFGIVFYDKSGNPLNVKWIGDIKIPEAYEDNGGWGVSYHGPYGPFDFNNPIYGQSIGIDFTVDISSIKEVISGYEIVRVNREESNKTRLGTGIFAEFTNAFNNSPTQRLSAIPGGGIDLYTLSVGGTNKNCLTLTDNPRSLLHTHGTGVIISPTTVLRQYTDYSHKSGDRLKTIGFYADLLYETGGAIIPIAGATSDNSVVSVNNLGTSWNHATQASREVRTIEKESPLIPGQELSTGWDATSIGSLINASPGTFSTAGTFNSPAGIGDLKQIVDMNTAWNQFGPTAGINSLDTNYWREISYERDLATQYGGNTYEARSYNRYISTGSFLSIKEESQNINTWTVYGGDVTVNTFAYQYFAMNWNDVGQYPQYGNPLTKYHLGMTFPCECPINIDYMQEGSYSDFTTTAYLNNLLPGGISAMAGPKSYVLPTHYRRQNTIKNIFYPADFIDQDITENPHRIWASEKKLDGELLDSWRVFLPNNFTEVDGQYGQINKITTARDIFHFYQDTAFGAASVNDRSVINDEDGVSITLGSGGILDDYGYISRNTGTRQKFSVVPTGMAIHHYDDILNKWVRYSDGPRPVSDVTGLHSTFRKFNGEFLKSDRTLLGKGIHGSFDKVRNKVHMTFLDAQQGINGVPNYDYTISYNENLQSFESFSDCLPSMYLESHGKLLTINPDLTAGYVQYEGEKNNFFGVVYPSVIELILNPAQDMTAIFDNIEYKGEISINDIDQSNLTLDSIRVINDHQDTGVISLVPDVNIRRRFRSWRTTFPRDINSPGQDARMRDYFVKLILTHTPNSNERMVLHDIQYEFRISQH